MLGAVLGTLAVGLRVTGLWAQAAPPQKIRIASFNIQVFGTGKAANTAVMTVLSRTARQFHVLAVQDPWYGDGSK